MSEEPLETCPDCGTEIEKQVTGAAAHFPKGAAALRNLGFARLEKRSDGTYENVSAQEGAQKQGSLESFSKDLTKGPKKIISD
jgi:predicted nucleic acid-binding Zn ribbon protein